MAKKKVVEPVALPKDFLSVLRQFIRFLQEQEKIEFASVSKITGKNTTDNEKRSARARDIKRQVRQGEHRLDSQKERYLTELITICPAFLSFIKRFDYAFFDLSHIKALDDNEILLASDYEMLHKFLMAVIELEY